MNAVDNRSRVLAAAKYRRMPRKSIHLFSLMSIKCPAYRANETAGITSDKPTSPIANAAFVNWYIHHPTKVVIMRKAIIKTNLPSTKFLNSLIRTAANGSLVVLDMYKNYRCEFAQTLKSGQAAMSLL